jgi:hypothetical protein
MQAEERPTLDTLLSAARKKAEKKRKQKPRLADWDF